MGIHYLSFTFFRLYCFSPIFIKPGVFFSSHILKEQDPFQKSHILPDSAL